MIIYRHAHVYTTKHKKENCVLCLLVPFLQLSFLLYFYCLAKLHSMWDLSSWTRDHFPCSESGVLTTRPQGVPLLYFTLFIYFSPLLYFREWTMVSKRMRLFPVQL